MVVPQHKKTLFLTTTSKHPFHTLPKAFHGLTRFNVSERCKPQDAGEIVGMWECGSVLAIIEDKKKTKEEKQNKKVNDSFLILLKKKESEEETQSEPFIFKLNSFLPTFGLLTTANAHKHCNNLVIGDCDEKLMEAFRFVLENGNECECLDEENVKKLKTEENVEENLTENESEKEKKKTDKKEEQSEDKKLEEEKRLLCNLERVFLLKKIKNVIQLRVFVLSKAKKSPETATNKEIVEEVYGVDSKNVPWTLTELGPRVEMELATDLPKDVQRVVDTMVKEI